MKCSICQSEIDVGPGGWSEGHNAEPVNGGRGCSDCNATVVIPARLNLFFPSQAKQEAEA